MWWKVLLTLTLLATMLLFGDTLKEKSRRAVDDPNVALLIISIGIALVYVECLLPGSVIPGSLGGVLVSFGVFGLWDKQISGKALALLLCGALLLLIEARFPLYGIAGIVGMILSCWGASILCAGMRPAWAVVIIAPLFALTLFLFRFAWIARRNKEVAFSWVR